MGIVPTTAVLRIICCTTMALYMAFNNLNIIPQKPCPENPEFAVLRFHAGPPYEDIAFKIVNREWEYSYKRGFRCHFHNNIFQLWFHFKRYRYRRWFFFVGCRVAAEGAKLQLKASMNIIHCKKMLLYIWGNNKWTFYWWDITFFFSK